MVTVGEIITYGEHNPGSAQAICGGLHLVILITNLQTDSMWYIVIRDSGRNGCTVCIHHLDEMPSRAEVNEFVEVALDIQFLSHVFVLLHISHILTECQDTRHTTRSNAMGI